jgi:hypothetical protein
MSDNRSDCIQINIPGIRASIQAAEWQREKILFVRTEFHHILIRGRQSDNEPPTGHPGEERPFRA